MDKTAENKIGRGALNSLEQLTPKHLAALRELNFSTSLNENDVELSYYLHPYAKKTVVFLLLQLVLLLDGWCQN